MDLGKLVGATGFEPATLRPRTVRATKLRYAPPRTQILAQFVPAIKIHRCLRKRICDLPAATPSQGLQKSRRDAGAPGKKIRHATAYVVSRNNARKPDQVSGILKKLLASRISD